MNVQTFNLKDRVISIDALRGLGSLFASNIRDFIKAVGAVMLCR